VLAQMLRVPDARLRRFGAVLMLVGLVLVYMGRRS
jgi:uncharacterized protein YjeT (DUF2065 family)